MSLPWKALDLLFSFLGKVSIVVMMGGVVLRAPGFTRLEEQDKRQDRRGAVQTQSSPQRQTAHLGVPAGHAHHDGHNSGY